MNGDRVSLAVIDATQAGVRLGRGEALVAVVPDVKLLELRSDGRVAGRGVSVSIPIVKGVRYRAFSGRYARSKSWQVVDTGRLLISSKNLIFDGRQANKRLPLSEVMTWGWGPRQLEFEKSSGRPLVL